VFSAVDCFADHECYDSIQEVAKRCGDRMCWEFWLRDPDAWVALASPDGTEDGSSQA
jgi:hypothetical protein